MLKVSNLEAGYGETTIIRDISFEVVPGEIMSVVGSNGAGKSTLMRAITGLIKPKSGSVTYQDDVISGLPAPRVSDEHGHVCLIPGPLLEP